MNQQEISEINAIPYQYRPMTAWQFFGWTILFSIPLVGFILLLIQSFNGGNVCRRSFARSYFCGLVIVIILYAIAFGTGLLSTILAAISQ